MTTLSHISDQCNWHWYTWPNKYTFGFDLSPTYYGQIWDSKFHLNRETQGVVDVSHDSNEGVVTRIYIWNVEKKLVFLKPTTVFGENT